MLAKSTLAGRAQFAHAHTVAASAVAAAPKPHVPNEKESATLMRLLAYSEILKPLDIDEAGQIASSLGRPVEQVLVSSGFLNQAQYALCRAAVHFVEREIITEAFAANGLAMACKKEIGFEEGLRYFGWGW